MLGIFGGTFDPPHCGHVALGRWLLASGTLSAVHYVVNHCPPHRALPEADSHHRLAMLKLALADESKLIADDREIRREGVSYICDSLSEFRAEIGSIQPLAFVVGSDALATINSWHNWQTIPQLTHLLVLDRLGTPDAAQLAEQLGFALIADEARLEQQSAGQVRLVRQPIIEVTATNIRAQLHKRQRPTDLPDAVFNYIESHKLYVG